MSLASMASRITGLVGVGSVCRPVGEGLAGEPRGVDGDVPEVAAAGVELHLPYPPSVNRYWRHNRGVTHLSKEGRDYRRAVADAIHGMSGVPITSACRVEIQVEPPDRRKRDIDNILKALLDALQHGGAIDDDYQVCDLRAWRLPHVRGGSCLVRIIPV
jgi:crossover junction endodeoxyribonuclease RusA